MHHQYRGTFPGVHSINWRPTDSVNDRGLNTIADDWSPRGHSPHPLYAQVLATNHQPAYWPEQAACVQQPADTGRRSGDTVDNMGGRILGEVTDTCPYTYSSSAPIVHPDHPHQTAYSGQLAHCGEHSTKTNTTGTALTPENNMPSNIAIPIRTRAANERDNFAGLAKLPGIEASLESLSGDQWDQQQHELEGPPAKHEHPVFGAPPTNPIKTTPALPAKRQDFSKYQARMSVIDRALLENAFQRELARVEEKIRDLTAAHRDPQEILDSALTDAGLSGRALSHQQQPRAVIHEKRSGKKREHSTEPEHEAKRQKTGLPVSSLISQSEHGFQNRAAEEEVQCPTIAITDRDHRYDTPQTMEPVARRSLSEDYDIWTQGTLLMANVKHEVLELEHKFECWKDEQDQFLGSR